MLRAETAEEAAGAASDDRVAVLWCGDAVVAIVADGAGNSRAGGDAADAVVGAVRASVERGRAEVGALTEVVRACDLELARTGRGGLTTVVVAVVGERAVYGVSVGDSGAWMASGDDWDDLTAAQQRKPLIGSGAAEPKAFGPIARTGAVLVATDGLLKYADRRRLRAAIDRRSGAPWSLVDAARMRSGRLPDDIALAVIA